MANMPIADPTTTDQPSAISRVGKVNGSLPAAIMQSILPIVVQNPTKLLFLSHPLALGMGAWFLAILISYIDKLSANKF
jgi:hypothetical protein